MMINMAAEHLGIVGGGQLGRMLTEAAKPMGFEVTVIDPGENCPAAQAGANQIQASLTDYDAVHELAEQVDVVTWEIEHINTEALYNLSVPVEPSPYTLADIKDKLSQHMRLQARGIPVADFRPISEQADLDRVFDAFDGKVIVKSRYGGYDGRGNMVVDAPGWNQVSAKFGNQPLYAERIVPFRKELAVVAARGKTGVIRQYPVVETEHIRNICNIVSAPADISDGIRDDAIEIAHETMRQLDGLGVFAIEMFLTDEDQVLVNEIAPRVHNSGHLTIEANATSQFEQHVRAVMGLPLGSADPVSPAVMINILGERDGEVEVNGRDRVLAIPETHLHLYGKSPTKVDRKMGHITVLADSVSEARQLAIKARKEFSI